MRTFVASGDAGDSLDGEWGVPVGLYAAEALLCLALFALYRLSAKAEGIVPSLLTTWGIILGVSTGASILLMFCVVRVCHRQQRAGSRKWSFNVVMNIVVVSMLALTGEVTVRFLATQKVYDEEIGGVMLLPRQWKKVTAVYGAVRAKVELQPAYMIPDPTLGWTIGQSRKSENEMYLSSVEGLRSAVQGESMSDKSTACRIALVGDSFTFGESVRFEDTWGTLLGDRLGGRCQILNFGVMGYGIDQAYLRYLQDVRAWHPDMVIFSFINDDLRRTMHVYGFLAFTEGIVPYTKPRFTLKGDELELLPLSLESPWDTFASASIHELPGIGYDLGYHPLEWGVPGWEWIARSYVLRYAVTAYPLNGYDLERPEVSPRESLKLNGMLISKLRQAILADGAQPLIVFFPSGGTPDGPGIQVLKEQQLPYIDVQACMKNSEHVDLFRPDGHFSVNGNRRAAECLANDVREAMQLASSRYAAH